MTSLSDDERFMALALALGRRGLGRTWPNPAVGAVAVRDDGAGPVIVGRGSLVCKPSVGVTSTDRKSVV